MLGCCHWAMIVATAASAAAFALLIVLAKEAK
jgi:hypothetical protein